MNDSQPAQITDEPAIKKDMIIADVVAKYPQAIEVFLEYGLHCVGCHVSNWETIEQGASGHGMDEDTIDMMIRDANEILQSSSHSVIDETADKSVKLTQAAIDRVKKYLAKDDSLMYFRIGVADGGCNGQSYTYTTERVAKDDDMIVIAQDIRVLVRAIDLPKLDGCTLDFVETLAESSFKIINPNAQSTCGCGNSFS